MNQVSTKIEPDRALAFELEASKAIIEQLKTLSEGDEDFMRDLVEGETRILDLIEIIDRSEVEDKILVDGLKAHIDAMTERKRRAEARIETKRTLIASALIQIGLSKHRTTLGTISVSQKAPIAIVTEEADIPARFWKPNGPSLDKKHLNDAVKLRANGLAEAALIEDQEARKLALKVIDDLYPEIPGATISNGGIQLTIRR